MENAKAGCSLWLLPVLLAVSGCHQPRQAPLTVAAPGVPVRFRDVTAPAGIHFALGHKGRHPLTILETSGCGVAFLDFDGDGWQDILLVGQPTRSPETACALYRNRGDGSFVDVTREVGLDRSALWMGCAVGDYDNDGFPDLLLTGYGVLSLYHNAAGPSGGPRRFVDISRQVGMQARPTDWFTSAGWTDIDHDGYLDCYIARYVALDAQTPQFCNLGLDDRGERVMGTCGPEIYAAQRGVLYHNRNGARFEEATARFGLDRAHGKAYGVAFGDFDEDGWPDLYVANDRMPGDLFRNRQGRRFESVGAALGVAYSGDSRPQAGMGVDWGDYDGDGRLDLIVTTFALERKSLYHNEGEMGFQERSDELGLSGAIPYVGWGNRWFDTDNDGRLDWVVANGHALDNMGRVDPAQPYAQPSQLFYRTGDIFRDVAAQACAGLARPIAGRGLAVGDYDNDGRADLLIGNGEGEPLLLHNESDTPNHWLRVSLVGRRGNRDGVGARVWVTTGAATQMREAGTGGSYLSASDPRILFGLGAATRVDRLRVRWPSGVTSSLADLPADRAVTIREP
jgi:hypothetical protein